MKRTPPSTWDVHSDSLPKYDDSAESVARRAIERFFIEPIDRNLSAVMLSISPLRDDSWELTMKLIRDRETGIELSYAIVEQAILLLDRVGKWFRYSEEVPKGQEWMESF